MSRAQLRRVAKLYESLHPITKDALASITSNPTYAQRITLGKLQQFNETPTRKTLERLVYSVHFHMLNELPPYLQGLRDYPEELAKFWPYEFQHSILDIENVNVNSLAMLWSQKNPNVLSHQTYDRHRWLGAPKSKTFNEEKVAQLTGVEKLNFQNSKERLDLSKEQRDQILQHTFKHYLFLKINPKLCATKKLPVPIVEIGMKPDGYDIADVRIDNLFRKKVQFVTETLYLQNPPISEESEYTLQSIIHDPFTIRPVRRLYKAISSKAFLFKDGEFKISDLARDGFVLGNQPEDQLEI
ncbi:YLR091W [Kluyveromyces marxianus]|uniref:Genetic interactor of prohibitin 5, mitochondrial n=1 Tax=Kluyveromyces marxianus TaxID=4911 RepID=A0ABX6EW97_KLUMA|nr:YLR091W [Kluyveromyces marxianus]